MDFESDGGSSASREACVSGTLCRLFCDAERYMLTLGGAAGVFGASFCGVATMFTMENGSSGSSAMNSF